MQIYKIILHIQQIKKNKFIFSYFVFCIDFLLIFDLSKVKGWTSKVSERVDSTLPYIFFYILAKKFAKVQNKFDPCK